MRGTTARVGTHATGRVALAVGAGVLAALLPALGAPARAQTSAGGAWSFASNGLLDPPAIEVTVDPSATPSPAAQASGYLFLAPIRNYAHAGAFEGKPGPEIVEANGDPVWEHPLGKEIKIQGHNKEVVAMDFHSTTYEGQPVLVWWEGYITSLGFGDGFWAIVDQHYRRVAIVRAPKDFELDFHDIQLGPGTAYIFASRIAKVDERCCGGPKDGAIHDSVLLEVSVKTGKVLWGWDPLQHVPLGETYTAPPTNGDPWDPYHLNSISFSPTGVPIVSARNTWAAYWIDRKTGRVLATLGGKHSSFKLARGARFAWQHDVHQQSDGQVSVFDDEAAPKEGRQSRALIMALDGTHHTASVAREYVLPSPALAGSQGNAQLLGNGNLFVGWGQLPYFSEYSAAGQLLYLGKLPGPDESYRAFRSPWVGLPPGRPSLALTAPGGLYASWNGATQIAAWRLLAGSSEASLAPAGEPVARQGFETQITPTTAAPYYAVQALDSSGQALGTSAAVSATDTPPQPATSTAAPSH